MKLYDVTVIGAGRLGGALAVKLSEKGYSVNQLVTKNREKGEYIANFINPHPQILAKDELSRIDADIVFITVQDSELENTAKELAENIENLPYVFHTSGSIPSSVLNPLKDYGCETGSIHPLVSVNDSVSGSKNFENGYFCLEGTERAVHLAQHIVRDLGGHHFVVNSNDKPLYHAAAVMTAGHTVALFSAAIEMLENCGMDAAEAQKILNPLLKSVAENLTSYSPAKALTGPFARADVETINSHLEALKNKNLEEISEIYTALGLRSAALAEQGGADITKTGEIRKILKGK